MANTGFKASQDGFDVYDVEKNLSFISSHQHLMVYKKALATTNPYTLTHGLGYAPAFDGYAKVGRKYFLNYMQQLSLIGFENTSISGKLYVDDTKLYADCAGANGSDGIVYLCYLNPIVAATGNILPSIDQVGLKFSVAGQNVLNMPAGKTALNTAYQCPMIIASGVATVVVDAIGPTETTAQKTNFVDVLHNQPQARHMICPDFYEKVGTGGTSSLFFFPSALGLTPPYVTEDYEVYVDDTKMRFRVSRTAQGVTGLPASASAKEVSFSWHMTNIILPS